MRDRGPSYSYIICIQSTLRILYRLYTCAVFGLPHQVLYCSSSMLYSSLFVFVSSCEIVFNTGLIYALFVHLYAQSIVWLVFQLYNLWVSMWLYIILIYIHILHVESVECIYIYIYIYRYTNYVYTHLLYIYIIIMIIIIIYIYTQYYRLICIYIYIYTNIHTQLRSNLYIYIICTWWFIPFSK